MLQRNGTALKWPKQLKKSTSSQIQLWLWQRGKWLWTMKRHPNNTKLILFQTQPGHSRCNSSFPNKDNAHYHDPQRELNIGKCCLQSVVGDDLVSVLVPCDHRLGVGRKRRCAEDRGSALGHGLPLFLSRIVPQNWKTKSMDIRQRSIIKNDCIRLYLDFNRFKIQGLNKYSMAPFPAYNRGIFKYFKLM